MRYGVIAVAVMSVSLGSTAPSAYGDTAYGVGTFMGIKAMSGIWSLDTGTAAANMLIHTPGHDWYGATDGPTADTFYAVANPSYTLGSELFMINTTTWTYESLGRIGLGVGGPIREIGWDESTTPGTLYGTDYTDLYTIPTTGVGAPAVRVGPFSPPATPPGDIIDYVFAMDYHPTAGPDGKGRLVGTSWRSTADQTDLYYFDRGAGTGTKVGYTNTDSFSDVWYSPASGKLFGVSQAPGRILEINPTTGAAVQIGTTPEASFNGMANATPGSPQPAPYVTAPLSDLGYETFAWADVDTVVDIPNVGKHEPTELRKDPTTGSNLNSASTVDFDVPAAVSGYTPWQNTNAFVTIDLSNASSIPDGMLRVSADIVATATGSNGDIAGVTRNSSVLGEANIHGSIGVGIPAGETAGMPVLFGAGVYTWGAGMQTFWDLVIKYPGTAVGDDLLSVNELSDPLTFSFYVKTGDVLDYEFNFDGLVSEAPNGTYDLFADVEFGAARVPEPATMLLICSGVIPILLKKRRRRS